jgi:glucokinase
MPGTLVGDIGGTRVRLALAAPGCHPAPAVVIAADDHDSLAGALEAGLAQLDTEPRPAQAVLALAGPVVGDRFSFTNRPEWSFSARALCAALALERLTLVNDFTALALALPMLGGEDTVPLGGPEDGVAGAPLAVLGPGTGLGVAGLVPCRDDWVPLAGEGGHASLAAGDRREGELLRRLQAGVRPSADRILSGPGLSLIYAALAGVAPEDAPVAAEIAGRAHADPHAAESLERFAHLLGGFAGDVALMLGARGGVYVGGGVVPRLGAAFPVARFRHGFEDKGRLSDYVAAIPTRLIVYAPATLLGAAAALGRSGPSMVTVGAATERRTDART